MRICLLLIVIFLNVSNALAQDNLLYPQDKFPTSSSENQIGYLKSTIHELNREEVSLKLVHSNRSKYSKHYTYRVFFKQVPVFSNYIKVNTDKEDNVLSIAKGIARIDNYASNQFESELKQWETKKSNFNYWPKDIKVRQTTKVIFDNNLGAHIVELQKAWDKTFEQSKLVDLNNELIAEFDHHRKLGIDTFINANVFDPDPLTFLNKMYGSPYVDSNDQNLPWMNAAYVPVNIPATYDTFVNKFFIENDYVKIVDIQSPAIPPSDSAVNLFFYDRSQPGFEECMVAYHIPKFQDHLNALGFDTLMDLQLEVDVHGQFGADNSVFNRNFGNPTMIFGDGGVDDAEDADVIIHEYCHGISWSANANDHTGSERIALDEGIADYFATSYSRNLSSFRYLDMFTWDGHNEFWGGRTANTANNYTKPWPSTPHLLGEVFNTAMQNIYTDLGRNTTDELMLEALFYFTDSTNLPSAAYYVLQADDLINGGANKWTICNHFKSKNLLSWDCYPTTTKEVVKNEEFKIRNSLGFAQGNQNLIIELNNRLSTTIQVFDINGRRIFKQQLTNSEFTLDPTLFGAGVYVLRIQNKEALQTVKLVKQ